MNDRLLYTPSCGSSELSSFDGECLVGAVFLWCLFIGWLSAGGGSNKGCAGICSILGRLDAKFWFLV